MGNSSVKTIQPLSSIYYGNVEMTKYFIEMGKLNIKDTILILDFPGNFNDKVNFLKHFDLDEDINVYIKAMSDCNIEFLKTKNKSDVRTAALKYLRLKKFFDPTMEFLVLNRYISMNEVETHIICSEKQYLYLFSDYGKCIYGLTNNSLIARKFLKNIKTIGQTEKLFKFAISLEIEIDSDLLWLLRLKVRNPYCLLLSVKTKNSEIVFKKLLETKIADPKLALEDAAKEKNYNILNCTLEFILIEASKNIELDKILTRRNSEKLIDNTNEIEKNVLLGISKIEDVHRNLWSKEYLYLFPENLKRIYGKLENQQIFNFYQN